MPLDLDDNEKAALVELLRDTIERDRFPLSPHREWTAGSRIDPAYPFSVGHDIVAIEVKCRFLNTHIRLNRSNDYVPPYSWITTTNATIATTIRGPT